MRNDARDFDRLMASYVYDPVKEAAEDAALAEAERLDLLRCLRLSPLREGRAWVLYQYLRNIGHPVPQQGWCAVAEAIGMPPAATERAIDDLCRCGLAALAVVDGHLRLSLLDNASNSKPEGADNGRA